jgi:hypothetical protein
MTKPKKLYNVDGLLTCSICNFALTAMAHATDDQAKNKTRQALARHLAVIHKLDQAAVDERMRAAEVLTK